MSHAYDIDPWDKPAPATLQPLTPDRLKDLHTDIYAYAWDDRTAVPELLARALRYIGERALLGDQEAIQTLDVMAVRSTSGIPFGEPVEPAWSLDPEVRIPRRGE